MSDPPPLLYLCTPREPEVWAELFRQEAPELEVRRWPEPVDAGRVTWIAAWSAPADFFRPFGRVKAVFALSAGVDRLLFRDDLDPAIPLIRVTDAGMAGQMVEYVMAGVLRFHRNFDVYARQQARREWRQQPPRAAGEVSVTVLGLGKMGGAVASHLAGSGYRVTGWSRSPRRLPGIRCFDGEETLAEVLAGTEILVSLLPSTPATRGLLDRRHLALLPPGAVLINAGRGDLVDIEALADLLDSGHLRGALMDVFPQEPLDPDHRLWNHPGVVLTPHIAANTLPIPSVRQIVERIRRLEAGEPVDGLVLRERAY